MGRPGVSCVATALRGCSVWQTPSLSGHGVPKTGESLICQGHCGSPRRVDKAGHAYFPRSHPPSSHARMQQRPFIAACRLTAAFFLAWHWWDRPEMPSERPMGRSRGVDAKVLLNVGRLAHRQSQRRGWLVRWLNTRSPAIVGVRVLPSAMA